MLVGILQNWQLQTKSQTT